MPPEPEITPTFTVAQARALAHLAGDFADVTEELLGPILREYLPDGGTPPLVGAVMALEVALLSEGCEL